MSLCWDICITLDCPKCLRKERSRHFYSCSSIAAAAISWWWCVFPNMVRGVTFPSHAWGIWPITTHWIAVQSERTSLFRTMSFLKIDVFQKGGPERSNNNVWYVENNVFFYFNPLKHIAWHQIYKIMFFLASSYDPFNCTEIRTHLCFYTTKYSVFS